MLESKYIHGREREREERGERVNIFTGERERERVCV
jgi:hypothetical protein